MVTRLSIYEKNGIGMGIIFEACRVEMRLNWHAYRQVVEYIRGLWSAIPDFALGNTRVILDMNGLRGMLLAGI